MALSSIAKRVVGQSVVRQSAKGVSALDVLLMKMVCLYIRVVPKIRDLLVVKLMPLSLGNGLKDLAILATLLMLPAERFCVEVMAGAGEAGGRGLITGGRGAWGSTKDCQCWGDGIVVWESAVKGACNSRGRNGHLLQLFLLQTLTWDTPLIPP